MKYALLYTTEAAVLTVKIEDVLPSKMLVQHS